MSTKSILISAYACFDNYGSEPGVGYRWVNSLNNYKCTLVTSSWSYNKLKNDSLLSAEHIEDVIIIGSEKLDRFFRKNRTLYQVYLHIWQFNVYKKIRQKKKKWDYVHHLTYGGVTISSFIAKFGRTSIYGPVGGAERAPIRLAKLCGKLSLIKELAKRTFLSLSLLDPFLVYTKRSFDLILTKNGENNWLYDSEKVKVKSELSISRCQVERLKKSSKNEQSKKKIVFSGRGIYWKGGMIALKAFCELRHRNDIELHFYGEGRNYKEWKEFVKVNSLENVIFHGRCTREQFLHDLINSNLLLFPSFHDSSGNSILEALCLGVPVLAFKLGGPSAIIDHEEMFINQSEEVIEDLANKVESLLRMSPVDKERLSNYYLEKFREDNLIDGIYL